MKKAISFLLFLCFNSGAAFANNFNCVFKSIDNSAIREISFVVFDNGSGASNCYNAASMRDAGKVKFKIQRLQKNCVTLAEGAVRHDEVTDSVTSNDNRRYRSIFSYTSTDSSCDDPQGEDYFAAITLSELKDELVLRYGELVPCSACRGTHIRIFDGRDAVTRIYKRSK